MTDKTSVSSVPARTSAAKLPQSQAGTLYNKIQKAIPECGHSKCHFDFIVHCTLKTAYVKHSFLDDTLNVRDRDENEALREQ